MAKIKFKISNFFTFLLGAIFPLAIVAQDADSNEPTSAGEDASELSEGSLSAGAIAAAVAAAAAIAAIADSGGGGRIPDPVPTSPPPPPTQPPTTAAPTPAPTYTVTTEVTVTSATQSNIVTTSKTNSSTTTSSATTTATSTDPNESRDQMSTISDKVEDMTLVFDIEVVEDAEIVTPITTNVDVIESVTSTSLTPQ